MPILLLILAGPALGAEALNNRSITPPEETVMTLTFGDNGRDISVKSGDVIVVEMETQGGTGYSWCVDRLDETRLKLLDNTTSDIAEEGIVGGPVLSVWRFKAEAPGETELKMLYYRVWEKKESAIKSFSVRLHITGRK